VTHHGIDRTGFQLFNDKAVKAGRNDAKLAALNEKNCLPE
jgi:hypothetical protein